MNKQDKDSKGPGQFGDRDRPGRKADLEERYQRNRDQAPSTENPAADDGPGRLGGKKRIREVLR